MQENQALNHSIKQVLFEQYSSTRKAFSSQQDSLDKAYTTILFAEIAFYISRITPNDGQFGLDCAAVFFIALSLFIVFISFIMSKSTLKIFQELMVKQIYAIDIKDNVDEFMVAIQSDEQLYNKRNYFLSQLNRHIPAMIFTSTGLCFFKASLNNYDVSFGKIYLILLGTYIIISVITFLITRRIKND